MARFARIDSQIRANRLILANRFRVPKLNPFFCESQVWGGLNANRRFEAIRANRSHFMKIGVSLIFFSLPFWKTARKTTRKARIFCPPPSCRTPKILEKEGKTHEKARNFLERRKARQSKKARKRRSGFAANRFVRIDSPESPRFALRIVGPSKVPPHIYYGVQNDCAHTRTF